MDNLNELYRETDLQEREIKNLVRQVEELRNAIKTKSAGPNECAEVANLSTENIKLNHRLAILQSAIVKEMSKGKKDSSKMESIQEILTSLFSTAISSAFPDLVDAPTVIALSKDPQFGDYQCNSAMGIANTYKKLGKGLAPRVIGSKILECVPAHPLIANMTVAGPGFVNVFLDKNYGVNILTDIFEHGVLPPPIDRKQKVLVDFSSPNIAKEMHVGHLRSTIIGESVCRLLEYLGHDVKRINHVGDWGTQFGMLIAHLQDKFPDYITKSPPIGDLQSFYKESKKRFDEDEEFKKRAYACVVKLQAFDPDYSKAWQLICDVSRREFQKVYDRLDITIEEKGESFYQSRMEKVVKELDSKNLLELDDGRKIMWADGINIPMTIVKSDGGFTYDTSDMAAIKYRIDEEKMDWLIYVTDVGQATHFDLVFNCAKKAKILDNTKRVDHVGFGVVLGEDKKKFKTRSGDTVRLIDLMDEGLKRSLDKLMENGRDKVLTPEELKSAQESVAYGCIKYADLSQNRIGAYVFSFDKMLEDKGNTAVYLLYAYTRIKSIARNANFTSEKIKELAKTTSISLDHEKEWKLGKTLLRFPDVLIKISSDLYLHHLCEYVYEVCTNFSEFYDNCYCIEKDSSGDIIKVNVGRILLAEATALIMAKCFHILGLKPVSRM